MNKQEFLQYIIDYAIHVVERHFLIAGDDAVASN